MRPNSLQSKLRKKTLILAMLGALPLPAIAPWAPAFAASAHVSATTRVVENCNDTGSGSLREAVEVDAISGDTVDLSQLTCSTITLGSGSIHVPQDDLTIVGRDDDTLLISGVFLDRLFSHTGSGTLEIDHAGMRYGYTSTDPGGGCIHSLGSVSLHSVSLHNCGAQVPTGDAKGGGVSAAGNVELLHSRVSANRASAGGPNQPPHMVDGGGIFAGGDATIAWSTIAWNSAYPLNGAGRGGGIFVGGKLTLTDSRVIGNTVGSDLLPDSGFGGGLALRGPFHIARSWIGGNYSYGPAGALYSVDTSTGDRRIVNCTISLNSSTETPAGGYVLGSLDLFNSTVAFNASTADTSGHSGGLDVIIGAIDMQSSIVSGNLAAGVPYDLGANVTGANNLIQYPGASPIPSDTLVGIDPMLGPLAFNGGATESNLPQPGSPVLDAGNNASSQDSDQRGSGFPRVVGAAADIGAVEVQLPTVRVDPLDLDFMSVEAGNVSAPLTTNVTNSGDATLHVDYIDSVAAPFVRSGGSCAATPFDLSPHVSCTLEFTFAPTQFGPQSTSVGIATDGGEAHITLHGNGLDGSLAVMPALLDFGDVAIGDSTPPQTVTLENVGTRRMVVTAIDTPGLPFVAIGGTCGVPPFELAVDASCVLDIGFAPQTAGPATQTLTVTSDVGNEDFTLTGMGVDDRIFAAGFEP